MSDSIPADAAAAPAAESKSEHPAVAEPLGVHVVSLPVLLGVFAALIVLTWLTVAASQLNLGDGNLALAIGIATVKASLVALFFMHLRYDNPFYAVLFVSALVCVALFISLTLLDTLQYAPEMYSWG